MTDALTVTRLAPEHAPQIVQCFHRVYGDSYANQLFYQPDKLAAAMTRSTLRCVGALNGQGRVLAHMAMTVHHPGGTPELGNTVVDPDSRGAGIAWQVGAELTGWCRELGFSGFLHYPTSSHHIMQRQSVKRGFETGLMLGYIPAETDGKVKSSGHLLRSAATIVYEPLAEAGQLTSYLPARWSSLIRQFAADCSLPRNWLGAAGKAAGSASETHTQEYPQRGLGRLTVNRVGADFAAQLEEFCDLDLPCLHLDFVMSDAGLDTGIEIALNQAFTFCGWLPGYRESDVVRLQKVQREQTDLNPAVVNPVARSLIGQTVA